MINTTGGNQLLDAEKILRQIGLEEKDQAADLGCGALGHFTFPASQIIGKEGKIFAVDIRQIVLQGIKNRARVDGMANIQTIWTNLEIPKSTGIPNDSLDVSMLITVLFQNKEIEPLIIEAIRITRSGGVLAIIDWKKTKSAFGPPADLRVDVEKILKICQDNGMKLEREFEPGKFHFGFIFKK